MPVFSHTQRFIKATCRELNTRYDQEALRLICAVGVFAADDPTEWDQAIERLVNEPESVSDQIVAAQQTAADSPDAAARRKAVCDLEKLAFERTDDRTHAAYLLGIAVGRRLGSGTLEL